MPKRFTDTAIWDKAWFRKLPPEEKSAFGYIKDRCDAVGVWDADFELAEYFVGRKVDWDHLRESSNGNIEILANGKWFVADFCAFQYGRLSLDSAPHRSYIKLLEKHGLEPDIIDRSESTPAARKRLTQPKKDEILLRDEFFCQYCSRQFEKSLLVVGHVIPIKCGGDNSDDNLVAACIPCNSKKSDRDLASFVQEVGIYSLSERVSKILGRVSKGLVTLKEKEKEKTPEKEKEPEKENTTPSPQENASADSCITAGAQTKIDNLISQLQEVEPALMVGLSQRDQLQAILAAVDAETIVSVWRWNQSRAKPKAFTWFLQDFTQLLAEYRKAHPKAEPKEITTKTCTVCQTEYPNGMLKCPTCADREAGVNDTPEAKARKKRWSLDHARDKRRRGKLAPDAPENQLSKEELGLLAEWDAAQPKVPVPDTFEDDIPEEEGE